MMEESIDQSARYALDIVEKICTEVGPGLPGTVQERDRAMIIKKELASQLGSENVTTEEFTFAPDAFLGLERINALFTLAAALLNMFIVPISSRYSLAAAAAAVVFSFLPFPLFYFQFVRAGEIIDPLFKKKTSVNVIGTLRKPGTQSVKRLLILGGHHDSAWEDTWLRLLGYGYYFAFSIFFVGMLVMLVMSVIQITGVISGIAAIFRAGTLGWVLFIFLIAPSVIFGLFWHQAVKKGGIVPGAVDNLAASALAVSACRFLVQHPDIIPEGTEIRFISFGSEEAGVRGSRRYVERHLDELKRLDARLLNIEMVADPQIAILTSDKNGTVKNHPEMVRSVAEAAERARVPYKVKPASLGTGTDAAPFSQSGLKATTLIPFKFPQQFVGFYHQRWDGPDKMTIAPLINVLKLTLEWIRCDGE